MLTAFAAQAENAQENTRTLTGVLQSGATVFAKARACQQLGEMGGPDAVPALAALLGDPQLAAYARSGLEGIPDPSAAAALREAAGQLKGPLLAGVVNSLGALRDSEAVGLLATLAADPGSGVAKEALLALGNIASPDSIRIVRQALEKGAEATRVDAAAAALLAAERQRSAGNLDQAVVLYDAVGTAKVPIALRVGATRGAILSRKSDQVSFLLKQLRSEESPIRNAALLTIREVPSNELAAALNKELGRAKPDVQRQILLALVDCHDAKSIRAVETLTRDSNPELRTAAFQVLGRLGQDAAPVLVAALERDLPAGDKTDVLNGLRPMKGVAVDEALIRGLRSARTPGLRIEFIRLLDNRGVTEAAGDILLLASGPDQDVSIAALSALNSLAGLGELPGLMALLKSCGDAAVREAAEIAVAGICSRPSTGSAAAEAVLNELKRATSEAERNSCIRILARVGYAKALHVITAAANDPAQAVAENAIRELGRWPDPSPMSTLLQTMQTGPSSNVRKLALGSVIDLAATAADEAQCPEQTIAQWLNQVNSAAQSVPEKRRILGIAGRLKCPESLQLLATYLDEPDLRTEAASGVVQIAPALAKGPDVVELQAALGKIAAAGPTPELQSRARQITRTIGSMAPGTRLFDGASLSGWQGDTNVWCVRDQVIVGGSLKGNPRNEFLATSRSYTNFVLRLEYRLVGTEGFVNSGVQFRSVRVSDPKNEMSGYQADIGAGHSGCLYDESRRNTFLARARDETIKRLEKPGEWNQYEVRCDGAHIQIWLNGEKTVDYSETDKDIPQSGKIALQIHGGNKAEVSFRNIMVREL